MTKRTKRKEDGVTKNPKKGWVTLPIRFYIEADSELIFKDAIERAKQEAWLSIRSSGGYSIESERASSKKYTKDTTP